MWKSLAYIVDNNNNLYKSIFAKLKESHISSNTSNWTKKTDTITTAVLLRQLRSHSFFFHRNGFHVARSLRFVPVFQQQQRYFRTSSRHNGLPPLVAVLLGQAARIGAAVGGRFARRWWQKLPPEERAIYAKKVTRNWYFIAAMFGATGLGSFAYYQYHVQETPFTNRKRFLAFTSAQIQDMSKLMLENLLEDNNNRLIPAEKGTAVYRRIVEVAERLLNGNKDLPQIRELEWSVIVVDDKYTANAFVLPCGSIFVYSGLLKVCVNDDQLGIILAHEMAHAVMQHGAEALSLVHFMDLLFIIPLAVLWALIPNDIGSALAHWIMTNLNNVLMELPHSRFIEEEADKVGMLLAAKACFDIREAPVVWAKMGMMTEADSGIEWTSTHPSNERRQEELDKMIPDAVTVRERCQCPSLSILDPRLKIEKMNLDKMKQKQEQ